MAMNTFLNLVTLVLMALAGGALIATKAGIATSAEEGAKAAIKHLQWPAELGRELQRSRGTERQELRFKSYGKLWAALRPLALYDDEPLDHAAINQLTKSLSDWYFSEQGGLLLTKQSREFYFALQDLLKAIQLARPNWQAARSATDSEYAKGLRKMLKDSAEGLEALDYFEAERFDDWPEAAPRLGKKWRQVMTTAGAHWDALEPGARFILLQQAGSKLRTSLVADLESRLR